MTSGCEHVIERCGRCGAITWQCPCEVTGTGGKRLVVTKCVKCQEAGYDGVRTFIDDAEQADILREKLTRDATIMRLNALRDRVHKANLKWWLNVTTGAPITRNVGELIALMHSELSEALEADRKSLNDQHLPHRMGLDVECADLLIRLLDFCGGMGIDIGTVFEEKMAYNAARADHTHEARRGLAGKRY